MAQNIGRPIDQAASIPSAIPAWSVPSKMADLLEAGYGYKRGQAFKAFITFTTATTIPGQWGRYICVSSPEETEFGNRSLVEPTMNLGESSSDWRVKKFYELFLNDDISPAIEETSSSMGRDPHMVGMMARHIKDLVEAGQLKEARQVLASWGQISAEEPKLRAWGKALEPTKVKVVEPKTRPNIKKAFDWIKTNQEMHHGYWVAIVDGELAGRSRNRIELQSRMKKETGLERVIFHKM